MSCYNKPSTNDILASNMNEEKDTPKHADTSFEKCDSRSSDIESDVTKKFLSLNTEAFEMTLPNGKKVIGII